MPPVPMAIVMRPTSEHGLDVVDEYMIKKRDKIITGLKRNEFKWHLIGSLIIIYYYT